MGRVYRVRRVDGEELGDKCAQEVAGPFSILLPLSELCEDAGHVRSVQSQARMLLRMSDELSGAHIHTHLFRNVKLTDGNCISEKETTSNSVKHVQHGQPLSRPTTRSVSPIHKEMEAHL